MAFRDIRARAIQAFTAGVVALCPVVASAEEGGGGHYQPGATGSFASAFPGKKGGVAALNQFMYYGGDAGSSRSLPLGGLLSVGIDATVFADSLTAFYQLPWEVEGVGYALGVAVPYVWVDIAGNVRLTTGGGATGELVSTSDSTNGFGDILIMPAVIGWTNPIPDLKVDARLGVYVPSGDYSPGRLANVGKNYWTFEPGIMASWLSHTLGTEASLYTGFDFNTENSATQYTSGTAFHADMKLAQHLPLFGGLIGVGASGFIYAQITGDSGAGAQLGSFRGSTGGLGPVVSYIYEFSAAKVFGEVKWLPEFEVARRMQGNYVWFTLGALL